MRIILSIAGIVLSFFMLKHRESVGDMLGGRYMAAVLVAVFLFLFSVASLTKTDELLLSPILWLFPFFRGQAPL